MSTEVPKFFPSKVKKQNNTKHKYVEDHKSLSH